MTKKDNGKTKVAEGKQIIIEPLDLRFLVVEIEGDAPYCQNKFSAKAKAKIREKQAQGSLGNKLKKKEKKDFVRLFEQAQHVAEDETGTWNGIPTPAFRNACISACRLAGFKMTHAKLSLFILADGSDRDDHTPLTRITVGEPVYAEHTVRNESGVCDLRPRPLWPAGWRAKVTVKYDAAQFSEDDVMNLLERAGSQVGIGEGRPDSKKSAGIGYGTFKTVGAVAHD